MAEQILIEFQINDGPIKSTVETLTQLGVVSEKDAAIFNKLNQSGTKAATAITAQSKNSLKSIRDIEKGVKSLSSAIQEGFAEGMMDALDEAGVSLDEFKKALKENGVVLEQITDKTDQFAEAESNLKKQLKDVKAQLALWKIEGKETTEQYEQLRKKAGEISDAIGDVNESISRTGSDTKNLDNLIDLAGGVAGGFAIMQGAVGLFGDENEELQKTLLKVNSAMAILQGLQQIQNLLSKEQFKSLGALIGLKKFETIQTNLQSAAENKNIVVRGAATVAQKTLNAVMRANPIGILLTAFAAIAGALTLFSNKNKESALNVELLNRQLEEQKRILSETVETIQFRNSIDISRAKQRGETEAQIHGRTIQGYSKEANEYSKSILQRTAAAEKFFNIQYQQINSLKDAQAALLRLDTQRAQQTGELSDQQKGFFDGGKIILEGIIDDYKNLNQIQRSIESTNADFAASQAQKRREQAKKNLEQAKTDAKANAAAEFEIEDRKLQQLAELSLKYANDETKPFAVRLIALEDYEQRQKAVIANRQAYELKAEKLTSLQKKNIIDKADKEIEKLKADNLQRQSDFIQANLIKETEIEIALVKSKLSTQLANAKEGSASQLRIKNALIEQEARAEKLAAQTTITDSKLLATEIERINAESNNRKLANDAQYYFAKADKIRQFIASQNNLETARLEVEINNPNTNANDRFRLEQEQRKITLQQTLKELADLEQAYRDGQLTDEMAYYTQRNNLLANATQESGEILNAEREHQREHWQKVKQDILQVVGFLENAYNSLYEINQQKRENDLQNAIEILQRQREQEVDNKNLTEKQKNEIDIKYKAKEHALRLRAFEADKRAKRSQAIINGALAALNALATAPNIIAGIALAAGVAVTTALQISKINSAQPPGYKKGTKNAKRGYAWVGEEGPELIYMKGGERVHPHKESLQIAAAWRGGALAKQDELIRSGIPASHTKELSYISVNNSGSLVIDYDKMGEAIAKHIKIPAEKSLYNNIDADGITTMVMENGSKRTIRNKRYKINN